MMKNRGKTGKRRPGFSVVKAVKANARNIVGQPRPAQVLPEKTPARQQQKHKPTLAQTLAITEDNQ